MTAADADTATPEIEFEWDELAPGGEISATVLMASGFVLQAGQRVRERYRVVRTLGEGAMGQVLAVTLVGGADQQTYALKVVARPLDTHADGETIPHEAAEAHRHAEWFAELLRAEAAKQDVVQRHGVSVARLFALVQLDDGSIGMRMELARGRSLEAQIDGEKPESERPPAIAASLAIARKLVSQLRRLHEMKESGSPFGFIHSDIKPGNVFVDDSDPTDLHVTLLDFGVATAGQTMAHDLAMRGGSRNTFVLKQTGGTLGYAPPYHFSNRATPLSDVYASIVSLYELITLELPWQLGTLRRTPDNLLRIEAAMLAGPRPVRTVRPSISARDAEVLDQFFRTEFRALHELGASAAQTLAIPDDDVQAAITERLARLARDYQSRLDGLRARFHSSRPPPPLPRSSAPEPAPQTRSERATVPSVPRAARVPAPAPEPEPEILADAAALPDLAISFEPPAPPAPTVVRAPRAARASWLAVALAVPLAGVSAVVMLRERAVSPSAPTQTQPAPSPDAAAPVLVPSDAATPVPTPAPTTVDAGGGLSIEALQDAPEVNLPSRWSTRARGTESVSPDATTAVVSPGAQRCSCIAAVSGARVVASGGALGSEIVLCAATERVAEGRAEFFGSGTIPAEVFGALPLLACRGSEPLELSVQRYSTPDGPASLFRCQRVPVAPPPPAPPPPPPPAAPSNSAGSTVDVPSPPAMEEPAHPVAPAELPADAAVLAPPAAPVPPESEGARELAPTSAPAPSLRTGHEGVPSASESEPLQHDDPPVATSTI